MQRPDVSVIVPAYNEQDRLGKTLKRIHEYLASQDYSWEVLVVLDGPTDRTPTIAKSFEDLYKGKLTVTGYKKNKGKGAAVRTGMLEAKGKIRMFTDSDNSTDIHYLEDMRKKFAEGFDVVISSRDKKDAKGAGQEVKQAWVKRQMGNMGNIYIQIMAVWGIWDTQNGFKGFTSEAAEDIFSRIRISRWAFDVEALALARHLGYKIGIIPIIWKNDPKSHVKLSSYFQFLLETLKCGATSFQENISVRFTMPSPAHNISQLRRDPVSGDWAVIATGRAKRPHEFKDKKKENTLFECPFDEPEKHGNEVVYTLEHEGYKGGWWVKVIKNKFPIVEGTVCGVEVQTGPYTVQEGAGYHEVIISRDHDRSMAQMTSEEILGLVNVYIERYKKLQELDCANYILIFHNHGVEAGASIPHPHSQIIAVPVIPPDVRRSLTGSEKYYREKGECVHCAMLAWERDEKTRIIYENTHMIVLSPYVPRDEFEIRIYPKVHSSFVHKSSPDEIASLADCLHVTLKKIYRSLSNPAYNFFVHTAPAHDTEPHDHYHWHIEILPKPPTPQAGFEMGTGIDVSMVDPDEVAKYLRDTVI